MLDRLQKDNLIIGVLIGLVSITIDYLILKGFNKIFGYFGFTLILDSRLIAIIIFTFNIILFRLMIVNWKRSQNGKGLFISILMAVFIYIYRNSLFHKI